jgi:hypothetical protein
MPYNKNASSMELLSEALQEIYSLSREAHRKNPLLGEGLELTPFQRVVLERDFLVEQGQPAEKGPSFLDRTTDAVEKLKLAAETAVSEIDAYTKQLDAAVFSNITAALNSVKADIEKKKPGDSFLSKIGAGAGMALKSLFGKQDDPVEEVTALIADTNMFKGVLSGALSTITGTLGDIEFVDDEGNKLEGDALQAKKDEILKLPIGEMLKNQKYLDMGFPDEAGFKKAVSKTFKEPTGMFSGFKKLGGSLGIGIGGDVPLADYIDAEAVFEDLLKATPEQLGATAAEIKDDAGPSPSLEAMGEPLQALQQTQQDNAAEIEQMAAGSEPAPGGEPAAPGESPDGGAAELKSWSNIGKAIARKVGGSQTILDKLKSNPDFQAALKDKLTFESRLKLPMHAASLSSLLYEVIEFEKVIEIGGGDPEDPVQMDMYTSISAALNDEIGEDVITNLPGSEGEGSEGEEGDAEEHEDDVLSAIKKAFAELRAEFDEKLKSGATKDDVEKILQVLAGEIPGLESEEASDLIDNPENIDAALSDVSPEDAQKIPDVADDAADGTVDGEVAAAEDSGTAVEVGKKYSYKSKKGNKSTVKALEEPFDKAGKKYFKGVKVEDGKEQSEKQSLAYSVSGVQGVAEAAAALETLKHLASQGVSLLELKMLSDSQILGLYFATGGNSNKLSEVMKKAIREDTPAGDQIVLVVPEEELGVSTFEEDDILSSEDMMLADLAGEEIAAELGPGPISKLEIAKLLKSMPDIVGAGYRATRARRCFRKAINNAAGTVICDESFDRSPHVANLLVEKISYDEKIEEASNFSSETDLAYRLNTLAGLNK